MKSMYGTMALAAIFSAVTAAQAAVLPVSAYSYGSIQPGAFPFDDPNLAKLTDGVIGGSYSDDKAVGFWNGEVQIDFVFAVPVTMDSIDLTYIVADFAGIKTPEALKVSFSMDGVSFGDQTTWAIDARADGVYTQTFTLSEVQTGQYIRLNLANGGEWIFLGEVGFNGAAVPEPASLGLLGLGGLLLMRRR